MMYQYTVSQWILFFIWYCFLGWIWESCYVSLKEAVKRKHWKWINRGFLNGPVLPIYGSAAIVILFATIPVQYNIVLIYLFGALAATVMELVTGSMMERIFHVKYWDYSNLPLNFHGHICFFVSLFWGVLAVLLVKVIHVPIENIILQWPGLLCEMIAFVFLAIFVFDFSISLREALDMRELLENLTDYREKIQRMEKRFDAVIAFTPIPDIDELLEKTANIKERIIYNLDKMREHRIERMRQWSDYLHQADAETFFDKEELQQQLDQQVRGIFSRTNKQFLRVTKHLRRNPGTISKKYAEALKEIKDLFEK